MKSIKTIMSVIFLGCLMYQTHVYAFDSCSYISISNDAEYQIKVNRVNGNTLFGGWKSYRKWENSSKLEVPIGNLEIVGSIVPDAIIKRKNKKPSPEQLKNIAPLYFILNVERGKTYNLSVMHINGKASDIFVDVNDTAKCDSDSYDAVDYIEEITTTSVNADNEAANLLKPIYEQIVLAAGKQKKMVSALPAGVINADKDNEYFVPRYQYYLGNSNAKLTKYVNLGTDVNTKLDGVIAKLAQKYRAQYPASNEIWLDFSGTELKDFKLGISLETQQDYERQSKKNQIAYEKVTRALKTQPPAWWNSTHMQENLFPQWKSSLYPGGRAERMANNNTNSSQ